MRPLSGVATAALAVATLSACGSGGAGTSASQAAKSGVVSPGTSLSVGQSAEVTYAPLTTSGSGYGKPTTLRVTVASLQTGAVADLKGFQFEGDVKGDTPQYATVQVTDLGPQPVDIYSVGDAFSGIDHGGNQQDAVSFIDTFPRCPENDAKAPVTAGHSFQTCLTFLVHGGITKVAYTGTQDYLTSPVTWAPK